MDLAIKASVFSLTCNMTPVGLAIAVGGIVICTILITTDLIQDFYNYLKRKLESCEDLLSDLTSIAEQIIKLLSTVGEFRAAYKLLKA